MNEKQFWSRVASVVVLVLAPPFFIASVWLAINITVAGHLALTGVIVFVVGVLLGMSKGGWMD